MIKINAIVGQADEPAFAERLHALAHQGQVEVVTVSEQDMSRRRLSLRTDKGTELALLLDRDAELRNGAILLLTADLAIVVALDDPSWLVLSVDDAAHALELGYFAGNMHWKVRFDGARLAIKLDVDRSDALKRLQHLLDGRAIRVEPEGAAPGSAAHEHAGGHSQHAAHAHAHAHPHRH